MPSPDLELKKRPGGGAVDIETLKRRSWPGITAHYVRLAGPLAFDFRIDQPTNFISLNEFRRIDGETSVAGLPRSYTKDLRNKLMFAPAGCLVEGWSQIAKAGSFVALHLTQPDPAQAASARQSINLTNLSPRVGFEDHALRMALLRFQEILHDPSLDVPGYAETLGELVAFELGRIDTQQPRQLTHQGGLTARQVRIVTEYMDGHLTEKITISELAALLDLTRFHFIRTFKQATGTPPHQFMTRRRVDRARELLADPRVSIAEVAERTGFGSSVQMSRAFRRVLGLTPSAVRRCN